MLYKVVNNVEATIAVLFTNTELIHFTTQPPWGRILPPMIKIKTAAARTASTHGTAPASSQSSSLGFLTVGKTARILGISPSTLRQWENIGLITPVRSQGRFRLYSPKHLEVLKRIKYLRDVQQIRVPGIKHVLREGPTDGSTFTNRNGAEEVAVKLRRLRKRCGLGIAEAARRAKISSGFLSAIELSQANPSVATLQRIAAVYDTTVLDFYDLPRSPSRKVRPNARPVLRTDSGVVMELLASGTELLQAMLFRVPAGSGSDGSYSHAGEEFLYMLAGTLELWLDELECHVLHAGDSFWFESTRGHRWFNPENEEAALLWVNTPPTF
jgi:DNA-binding transcriptional MerR regulator/quercetin dioxygenase-like cupin family protein